MGLSSSKTTTTSGPSAQALPYLTSASSALQSTYDKNQPNLDRMSAGLGSAFGDYQAGMADNPTLSAAKGYTQDVLGGKYLHGNPQLDNIIGQTNSDIQDRINALFSRSGQTGSSRQIGELGKQLSNSENNLRYNDYNTQMGRMDNAVGAATGLNTANNANYQTLAGLGTTAAELPYIGADHLAEGLGGLWGNAQTTTQKQKSSLGQMLLQAGSNAAGAAAAASDRRLKTNIRKVGELADGLGVYVWNYIWGGPEQRGVMADEVARLRPHALGPKLYGEYATVNYGAL